MFVWRLTRTAFRALDGEGARLYGGRWNSAGRAVVYTSGTLSLAALEYLVHIDREDAPDDLLAMRIAVPDELSELHIRHADLPPDWKDIADHPACLAIGDAWIRAGALPLLRVPSAVVPEEENILINPRHPEASRIRIDSARPFRLDGWLLG